MKDSDWFDPPRERRKPALSFKAQEARRKEPDPRGHVWKTKKIRQPGGCAPHGAPPRDTFYYEWQCVQCGWQRHRGHPTPECGEVVASQVHDA